jgi:transposase
VLADKAYSSAGDPFLATRRRGSHGGRPPAFDSSADRRRNVAERCINRLKQWRGLAMRTDRLALRYQAALTLAGILFWTSRMAVDE